MRPATVKRLAGTALVAGGFGGLALAAAVMGPAGATSSDPGTTTTTTTPTGVQVAVVAGPDRVATAVAVSKGAFATAGSAKAVVLATDVTFPDALAGGPLAAFLGGPLLLTDPNTLNSETLTEIQRVLPAHGTVYVLGGTGAISAAVSTTITNAGFAVQRVAGVNRFATAAQIAGAIGPTTVILATGLDFPDALAAGPAASLNHGAILLTNGSTEAPETSSYLSAHSGLTVYAAGGPAAAADSSATPLVGSDRFGTAIMVANKFFSGPRAIGLVSGLDFPDALSAVPLLAEAKSPMILVNPTGALPSEVSTYLTANHSSVVAVIAFGGSSALSESVISEVTDTLNGSTTTTTTSGSTTTTTSGSTTTTMPTTTTMNSGGTLNLTSLLDILSLLTSL